MLSNLTSLANTNKKKDEPKEDDGFGDFGDFEGTKQEDNKVADNDGFGDFGDFESNNTQPQVTTSNTPAPFPKQNPTGVNVDSLNDIFAPKNKQAQSNDDDPFGEILGDFGLEEKKE